MDDGTLFDHLLEQHDLTLVESELNDIIHIVRKQEKYCGSCGEPKDKKHKFWCERTKVN